MLIDNRTTHQNGQATTIFEYFQSCLGEGEEFKLVTGYYSLQTFAKLLPLLDKYENLELVLGHIAGNDGQDLEKFYLKNETLTISDSLDFVNKIPEIINFLKQDKVQIKTTNPEFCHAKVYLSLSEKYKKDFAISGSSNFTPSGLGQIPSSNIELNHVFEAGNNSIEELEKWFDELYKKALENKDEVLAEIEKYYKTEYSPEEVYNLILWHFFNQDIQESLNLNNDKFFGRLTDTVLWEMLYPFQKTGVMELILRLEKYNFGILADGVGLGKTWQTLGIIKYYSAQDLDILVICPAKLKNNWEKYMYSVQNMDTNPFGNDKIKYDVLSAGKLNNPDNLKKYDLIVIDESHNFRDQKSQRYQNLIQNLQKDKLTKVLMLSATPINNKIKDLKNQFKLGFCHKDNPEIFNFDNIFTQTQNDIKKLENKKDVDKETILKAFQPDLVSLISNLTIARNRSLIKKHYPNSNLNFPKAVTAPVFLDDFAKIVDLLFKEDSDKKPKIGFHFYKPSRYLLGRDKTEVKKTTEDQEKRETWLAKMMLINLLKRLESSTHSFLETMLRMIQYMESIVENHENYTNNKAKFKNKQEFLVGTENTLQQDELEGLDEEYSNMPVVGKKKTFGFDELSSFYFTNGKKDLEHIKTVYEEVKKHASTDNKLDMLSGKITNLLKTGKSGKILIFTSYFDTAKYLFDNLTKSYSHLSFALVSSSNYLYKQGQREIRNINFNQILRSFSPESMIFNELNKEEKAKYIDFQDFWQHYQGIEKQSPVDILIATDCISEGQNLQDCDTVINYDIHWNPVKLIQRNGRIDRIGSKFGQVNIVNFWPGKSLEDVIDLKGRVDFKMKLVEMAGGTDNEDDEEKSEQSEMEKAREKQVLEMLNNDYSEIENMNFGFGDVANLNPFKEEFLENYKKEVKESLIYNHYPKGIYSGADGETEQLIVLLKNKKKLNKVETEKHQKTNSRHPFVMYQIDLNGQVIKKYTQLPQILEYLKSLKTKNRFITEQNEPSKNLEKYTELFQKMVENYKLDFEEKEQNNFFASGDLSANKSFSLDDFELITWMIISRDLSK
jgi:ERCC4-related helicase